MLHELCELLSRKVSVACIGTVAAVPSVLTLWGGLSEKVVLLGALDRTNELRFEMKVVGHVCSCMLYSHGVAL